MNTKHSFSYAIHGGPCTTILRKLVLRRSSLGSLRPSSLRISDCAFRISENACRVIRNPDSEIRNWPGFWVAASPLWGEELLVVQRSPSDPDLPGAWGLPAGTLRPGEAYHEGIARTGLGKLGVELEVLRECGEGTLSRPGYLLHMKLFEARILKGEPRAPQADSVEEQYMACRWALPEVLRAAATRGSLCSRLFLQQRGVPLDAW